MARSAAIRDAVAGLLALAALSCVARAAPAAGDDGASASAPAVVLDHARILSADGTSWRDDHALLVRDGRIAAIAESGALEAPDGAPRIDLGGRALLPGLIDLHTHLLLHPYDETPWDEQVLKEPLELRTIRATVAARATLEAGFTTIRELGTEGAGFADVALRDSIRLGIVVGPRIFAATRAIVASGCYGPQGFDPRVPIPKGAEEADGADGVRRAVRGQIAAGADWIKLYADYRRRPDEAATPTFSEAELRAAVDEAASAGRKVSVHATTDAGIARAVAAGVATVEHGDGVSDATLARMKEQGVALVPTLAAVEALALQSGWKRGSPPPPRLARALDAVRRAHAAGVTIGCGSDAGVFAHGTNAREIELLCQAGLTPAEALRAATATAAGVLGRADLGTIAVGARADLLAVDGDPLLDPAALRQVAFVVTDGIPRVDRRAVAPAAAEAKAAALAFCARFLADYSQPDFDAVERAFAPDASIAFEDVASGRCQTLSAARFVTAVREHREQQGALREWIEGEATVLVDDAIATVWAPFRLESARGAGRGVDVFQLIRLGDGWRIGALAWTFRAQPAGNAR